MWWTSGERSGKGSGCEGPRHRRRRVHQRLPRAGPAGARARGRRDRRLQQVRPAHPLVRRSPPLPFRRGRREGRRPAHRAGGGLRPGRRRRGDDRRDQLLPRVRLRPHRRERADPGGHLRRGDRGPPGRSPRADRGDELVDGLRVGQRSSRHPRAPSSRARRRSRRTASRSSPASTSRKGAHEQYGLPYTILRPVQLRRHRRAAGGPRLRRDERQRQARAEPRRPGPRAQERSRVRTRSTSWARATRSGTTPTAAIWRAASAWRWSPTRP